MSKKKSKPKKKQQNLIKVYSSLGVEIQPMKAICNAPSSLNDFPIQRTYSTFEFEKQQKN